MVPCMTMQGEERSAESPRVIMRQYWRDLLFLHWRCDADRIASTLPPGLSVETFGGSAWVGLVPFRMEKIRVLGMPLPPGLNAFPELNLRTYVRDEKGRSGVWFYSLDAGDRFAVWGARTFFHLNYHLAQMKVRSEKDGLSYTSRRHGMGPEKEDRFRWQPPVEGLAVAEPGSLEYFLIERYRLFAWKRKTKRLYTGIVSHEPYRFRAVEVEEWSTRIFDFNQFPPVTRPPDSCLAAPGFPVKIHPLRPADSCDSAKDSKTRR